MRKWKAFLDQLLISIPIFITLSEKTHTKDYDCDTQCDFPFKYDGNIYEKCAIVDVGNPWCATNISEFNEWTCNVTDNIEKNINLFWKEYSGWEYCSKDCLVDDRCPKCQPAQFKGQMLTNCAYEDNQIYDLQKQQTAPWSVINATEYSQNSNTGWQYCPKNCAKKDYTLDIIIVASVVVLFLVVVVIFLLVNRKINKYKKTVS